MAEREILFLTFHLALQPVHYAIKRPSFPIYVPFQPINLYLVERKVIFIIIVVAVAVNVISFTGIGLMVRLWPPIQITYLRSNIDIDIDVKIMTM